MPPPSDRSRWECPSRFGSLSSFSAVYRRERKSRSNVACAQWSTHKCGWHEREGALENNEDRRPCGLCEIKVYDPHNTGARSLVCVRGRKVLIAKLACAPTALYLSVRRRFFPFFSLLRSLPGAHFCLSFFTAVTFDPTSISAGESELSASVIYKRHAPRSSAPDRAFVSLAPSN